jgi:hypothetical protein
MHRPANQLSSNFTSSRLARLCLIFCGIVATQAILYGPALLGRKIMLPLDLLAQAKVYIPQTPEIAKIPLVDPALSDLLFSHEISRRFVHDEVFAGRIPLWQTQQYCGSPNIWPWYSPFLILAWSTASPVIWAWVHLFEALVAGFGMYAFLRRVVGVTFWAAAVPAWCYPLTGFFIFWQGNPTGSSAFWLPWLLFTVDRAARIPRAVTIGALAGVTLLVLISGHLDVAGQCLLVAGLFGIWCLVDEHRSRWLQPAFRKAVLSLGAGWLLGFLLAAPCVLPVLEYAQTGVRMARRGAGEEERPPGSLRMLPKIVVPDMHGTTRSDSLWLASGNQIESLSAAYSGVLTVLLLAPLAWYDRRRRAFNIACAIFTLLGLAWSVGLPGFVTVLRLPLLNMMSHNRLVFATSFFLLCQAAIGLEQLAMPAPARRRWWLVPPLLIAALFLWCASRTVKLPEPMGTQAAAAVAAGFQIGWVRTLQDVAQLRAWFQRAYGVPAFLILIASVTWLWWLLGNERRRTTCVVISVITVGEMIWFAQGRGARADPALYFPPVPSLTEVRNAPPGRILGASCLPATIPAALGLRDIRGYDAVDPSRFTELLGSIAAPDPKRQLYAATQWFTPARMEGIPPDGVKLPPILDMLGVRYVIFRGSPPAGLEARARSLDYWVLLNHSAMPRVFVPRTVEREPDSQSRLLKLAADQFDPRITAYVETAVTLPPTCAGTAKVESEVPMRVVVSAEMATAGLVVLGDRWDVGWKAYLDGTRVPILQVNHALRGVVVAAGSHTIEFRYESASLRLGLWFAVAAVALLAGLLIGERMFRTRAAVRSIATSS